MGNTLPTLAVGPAYDLHAAIQSELPDFVSVAQIGKGKFTKSFLCRRAAPRRAAAPGTVRTGAGDGSPDDPPYVGESAVVKVYLKRGDRSPEAARRLDHAKRVLARVAAALNLVDHPNVVPFQACIESSRHDAAFLIRQHFQHSLADRLNSRPFLGRAEKLWLVYQLLAAVAQAHSVGVRHGDIKTENVMVTSWGWALLTDFALGIKPAMLPDDHPADFYFFFEAGTRSRCYIAPERFVRERDLMQRAAEGGGASLSASIAAHPAAALAGDDVLAGTEDFIDAGDAAVDTGAVAPSSAATSMFAPTSVIAAAAAAASSSVPSATATSSASRARAHSGSSPATAGNETVAAALRPAMDVFSIACVIAEVLLDGEPLFDLPSLLRYKSGSVGSGAMAAKDAAKAAAAATDADATASPSVSSAASVPTAAAAWDPLTQEGIGEALREADPSGALIDLLRHMLQRDPARRASASAYLEANTAAGGAGSSWNASASRFVAPSLAASTIARKGLTRWRRRDQEAPAIAGAAAPLFPAFFPQLHAFMATLLRPELASADARVAAIAAHYGPLLFSVGGGLIDPVGERYFAHRVALEDPAALDAWLLHLGGGDEVGARPAVEATAWASEQSWARSKHRHRKHHYVRYRHGNHHAERDAEDERCYFSVAAQRSAAAASELAWEWGFAADDDEAEELIRDAMKDWTTNAPDDTSRDWSAIHQLSAIFRLRGDGGDSCNATTAATEPKQATTQAPSAVQNQKLRGGVDDVPALLSEAATLLSALLAEENVTAPTAGLAAPLAQSIPAPKTQSSRTRLQRVNLDEARTFAAAGVPLLLPLLTSCLRGTSTLRSRVTATLLLSRISSFADDESRLQRTVPYLVSLLSDPAAPVRAHALLGVASAVEGVRSFPPSDAALFSLYLLPLVEKLAADPEPLVQLAVAAALPSLALTARAFLDAAAWRAQVGAMAKAAASASTAAAAAASSRSAQVAVQQAALRAPTSGGLAVATPAVRIRSAYDYELVGLHQRVQAAIQKWLFTAGSTASTAVSMSNVADYLNYTGLSTTARVHGDVPTFDDAILSRLAGALSSLPASLDVSLAKRALLAQAGTLVAFFGRREAEEFVLPTLFTFLQVRCSVVKTDMA